MLRTLSLIIHCAGMLLLYDTQSLHMSAIKAHLSAAFDDDGLHFYTSLKIIIAVWVSQNENPNATGQFIFLYSVIDDQRDSFMPVSEHACWPPRAFADTVEEAAPTKRTISAYKRDWFLFQSFMWRYVCPARRSRVSLHVAATVGVLVAR